MSFLVNTKERSVEIELMDDFSVQGDMIRESLDQIAKINKWLGGNLVTLNGLEKIVKNHPKSKPLTILDLGCGNGDMLREISKFGRKSGYKFILIGIDANEHTIDYAEKLSVNYSEISYLKQDVFSAELSQIKYDVVLATLFLHHFTDEEILNLISSVVNNVTLGIVINDLDRNSLAYYIFYGLGFFIRNPMTKKDGLVSILKAFKRVDFERISNSLHLKSTIKWKWAFRYQWVIQK